MEAHAHEDLDAFMDADTHPIVHLDLVEAYWNRRTGHEMRNTIILWFWDRIGNIFLDFSIDLDSKWQDGMLSCSLDFVNGSYHLIHEPIPPFYTHTPTYTKT